MSVTYIDCPVRTEFILCMVPPNQNEASAQQDEADQESKAERQPSKLCGSRLAAWGRNSSGVSCCPVRVPHLIIIIFNPVIP